MGGPDGPGRRDLREPSWVLPRAPLQESTLLGIMGKRRCPGGCGALLDKGGPDHPPEECLVTEVMSS